jgi:hypothetical protein
MHLSLIYVKFPPELFGSPNSFKNNIHFILILKELKQNKTKMKPLQKRSLLSNEPSGKRYLNIPIAKPPTLKGKNIINHC